MMMEKEMGAIPVLSDFSAREDATPPKEYHSSAELLQGLSRTDYVQAVMLIDEAGFVLEGCLNAELALKEDQGTPFLVLVGAVEALCAKFQLGEMHELLTRCEHGVVLLSRISETRQLVILAEEDATVGLLWSELLLHALQLRHCLEDSEVVS